MSFQMGGVFGVSETAAALYLFHHVSGDHLEEVLLLPCYLPWFCVERVSVQKRKTIRAA